MQDNRHSPVCATLDTVRNRDSRQMRLPCGEYATRLWGLTRTNTSAFWRCTYSIPAIEQ